MAILNWMMSTGVGCPVALLSIRYQQRISRNLTFILRFQICQDLQWIQHVCSVWHLWEILEIGDKRAIGHKLLVCRNIRDCTTQEKYKHEKCRWQQVCRRHCLLVSADIEVKATSITHFPERKKKEWEVTVGYLSSRLSINQTSDIWNRLRPQFFSFFPFSRLSLSLFVWYHKSMNSLSHFF